VVNAHVEEADFENRVLHDYIHGVTYQRVLVSLPPEMSYDLEYCPYMKAALGDTIPVGLPGTPLLGESPASEGSAEKQASQFG
jgi:hypothetical protein